MMLGAMFWLVDQKASDTYDITENILGQKQKCIKFDYMYPIMSWD